MQTIKTIKDIILQLDPEVRIDMLNRSILEFRSGDGLLDLDEANSLCEKSTQEQDGLAFIAMWELLEHAPESPSILNEATRLLNSTSNGRGSALRYVWKRYPENRRALLERYDSDPDPYVQHALAQSQSKESPSKSLDRWVKLLSDSHLTPDLDECIPFCIAEYATRKDVDRLDAIDRKLGGSSSYGTAVQLIRQRRDLD